MKRKIMEHLGFSEEVIREMENGNLLCSTPVGLCEISECAKQKLEELQQEFGDKCQFYHVMEYGLAMDDGDFYFVEFLMYCPDEWEMFGKNYMLDRIREGEVRSYCWCIDNDEFTEVGPIGVKIMDNGALLRNW